MVVLLIYHGGKLYQSDEAKSRIKVVEINPLVAIISDRVFQSFANLSTVDLSSSNISSIGDGAFSSCPQLATIAFPTTMQRVGVKAFFNCGNLKRVDILGRAVLSIGHNCFYKDEQLTQINIPRMTMTTLALVLEKWVDPDLFNIIGVRDRHGNTDAKRQTLLIFNLLKQHQW